MIKGNAEKIIPPIWVTGLHQIPTGFLYENLIETIYSSIQDCQVADKIHEYEELDIYLIFQVIYGHGNWQD